MTGAFVGAPTVRATLTVVAVYLPTTRNTLSAFELPKFEMPKFEMPKVTMPEVKVPDVKVPEVKMPDVSAMTTQARDKVSGTVKSVRGNVSHTVDLIREAVGV